MHMVYMYEHIYGIRYYNIYTYYCSTGHSSSAFPSAAGAPFFRFIARARTFCDSSAQSMRSIKNVPPTRRCLR